MSELLFHVALTFSTAASLAITLATALFTTTGTVRLNLGVLRGELVPLMTMSLASVFTSGSLASAKVVSSGSGNEMMFPVNTRPMRTVLATLTIRLIMTLMINVVTFWNRTHEVLVGVPMGANKLAPHLEDSVSLPVLCGIPGPALVRLSSDDLGEEAAVIVFGGRRSSCHLPTIHRPNIYDVETRHEEVIRRGFCISGL